MNDEGRGRVIKSAAERFLEQTSTAWMIRVSPAGIIISANAHSEALVGEPLAGKPWDAILLKFGSPLTFAEWLSDPARPRLLNVHTAGGLPQTLSVTVEEEDGDLVLFGEVDAAEQAQMAREVLELNHELHTLSREVARRNADLARSLAEKEGLLKETHHRVKNNLTLIASLARLSGGRSSEPETKALCVDMQSRIQSVALLNEALYRTASYTTVGLARYLEQVATHVFRAHASSSSGVRLAFDLEPVEVATAQAIPCALIVNELMTNSLKHAFPLGRGGEVRVSLKTGPDGQTRLGVSDDGVGLPADLKTRRSHSLGLQLVGDLTRQLQGALEVGPGAAFAVTFRPRKEGSLPRRSRNGE